jgi:hypothetical protein
MMEPNEYRVLTNGIPVSDASHDLMGQVVLARGLMATTMGGMKDQVTLEGRMVSPWRDMDIPYPPDKEE